MSDDMAGNDTAFRLKCLLDKVKLTEADHVLASRCLRRITQPLRLTIWGTEPDYAIPLLNLLVGQSVVSPAMKRARVQFLHGEVPHAKLQFRGGKQKILQGKDFRRLFEDNPSRARIYVDLPALKKMSMLVALDTNPKALCADADRTLGASDITIWTGSEPTEQMKSVWHRMPTTLRDHSYLALAQRADLTPWQDIEAEFVDVLRVNPIRAHNAKTNPDGVDKEGFRAAGGTQIVRAMKSEIEMLVQSANDAAEMLLARYADQIAATPDFEKIEEEPAPPEQVEEAPAPPDEPSLAARIAPDLSELPSLDEIDPALVEHIAPRPKPTPKATPRAKSEPRTFQAEYPVKNMPVRTSRPISKLGSRPRIRSRKSRPAATPWSMDL